ncbi:MAG: tRNA (adenosine(37)-N6)-dimethylallyltransferase MiaA [Candidatus Pacebacteria bacterium]|nr:tRNA (adenosine(37)-N6)-dimethylallyltransferase MiaA [Candidatus Paceibacterota bacterium]
MKPKIIVIVGPTASGKSDLAVNIAKERNGEIISADSRQVYKGLDIGSGKITKREMRGVPHFLLDVANPKKVFTVADFKRLGQKAIDDILSRGKTPIIVGGTGFYIDTLVFDLDLPEVPPNKILREKLEKKTIEELFAELEKLDPERAEEIDSKNKVRLVRALEIVDALGKIPKVNRSEKFNIEWIGIDWPDEVLKERIHTRLLKRIKSGMIKEAENLHVKGLSYKRMEQFGLEYRYMSRFLKGEISKEEMISELETKIRQYAKRQRTWFKRNKNIKWINPQH